MRHVAECADSCDIDVVAEEQQFIKKLPLGGLAVLHSSTTLAFASLPPLLYKLCPERMHFLLYVRHWNNST